MGDHQHPKWATRSLEEQMAGPRGYEWPLPNGTTLRLVPGRELPEDECQGLIDHVSYIVEALDIYVMRERKYRGAWKILGWKDSIHHIISKSIRLRKTMWERDEEDRDSLLDLINYAVFALRNIQAENRDGS